MRRGREKGPKVGIANKAGLTVRNTWILVNTHLLNATCVSGTGPVWPCDPEPLSKTRKLQFAMMGGNFHTGSSPPWQNTAAFSSSSAIYDTFRFYKALSSYNNLGGHTGQPLLLPCGRWDTKVRRKVKWPVQDDTDLRQEAQGILTPSQAFPRQMDTMGLTKKAFCRRRLSIF